MLIGEAFLTDYPQSIQVITVLLYEVVTGALCIGIKHFIMLYDFELYLLYSVTGINIG